MKAAQQIKKEFNISDKIFGLIVAKSYILLKKYDDLGFFMDKENAKKAIIPFEYVSDLLIKAGERDRALGYIKKMPDTEE